MKVKLETLVIKKDAYFFLKNWNRQTQGFSPLDNEQLEKFWTRLRYRNQGASNKEHPIAENEIRITKDTFGVRIEYVKAVLNKNGHTYRQDNFIQECIYA